MKKNIILFFSLLLIFFSGNLFGTDVNIMPSNDLIHGGESVTYHVDVFDVTALEGFTINVSYQTDDFKLVYGTVGDFLSNDPSDLQFICDTTTPGIMYVTCTLLVGSSGASGNGTLFYIHMTSKHVNNLAGSAITLPYVELRDINNQTIPCNVNGSLVIIDDTAPEMNSDQPLNEPENAYYNRPPTFDASTYTFTDNHNLYSVDFNLDGGSWIELASGINSTIYPDPPAGWELPIFYSLLEGTHTVNWQADDDADNSSNWDWDFYKDTQPPVGTLSISFSNVTENSMDVTGATLTDATQGSVYYEFVCTAGGASDRGRLLNDNTHELTSLNHNTNYTFKYQCSDGVTNNVAQTYWDDTCNKTNWSVEYSKYTLSNTPTTSNVTCDKNTGQWYNDPVFTFTAVGGFGESKNIEYYRYAWDRSSTHTWSGVENIWDENATTATTIELSATESGDDWYLHLKGYNGDNVANGTLDLGPYKYDGICPCPVSNFTAVTTDLSDTSVDLNWSNPALDVMSIHVFTKPFGVNGIGTYPYYNGAAPTVPSYQNAVTENWTELAVLPSTNDQYNHEPAARNEWYYVIFVEDNAGNISCVSTMEHALSYWLGDVNVPPNGLVNSDDIALLAASWGADGTILPHIYRNVGPTTDNCRDSRPVPDAFINFEDLMIFSLNYGNTCYLKNMKNLVANTDPINIVINSQKNDGQLLYVIKLIENESVLHGFNINLSYDENNLILQNIQQGEIIGDKDFFICNELDSSVEISCAALGNNAVIGGNGALAVLTFKITGNPEFPVTSVIEARDMNNEKIEVLMNTGNINDLTDTGHILLLHNFPNPFTHSSIIEFFIPERSHVKLEVFNLLGIRISTLVDDFMDEGIHQVIWNRTYNAESSGIYFYKLDYKGKSFIRKALIID